MTFLVTRPREQYPADALAGIAGDARGRLRAAAWLAQLAYEDDAAKVDSIARDWSLRRILSRAPRVLALPWQPETRLHVLEPAGGTAGPSVVTVCGTDPLRFANWVTNLNVMPAAGGVHSGFLAALDAAWPDLEPVLRERAGPVWIVGHSLGAAIAALGALRACETLALTPEAVYAFGMPRVGGEAFAARYEALLGARTLRLVHGHDVVPRLPPDGIGFRHVGRRLTCAHGARFDPAATAAARDEEPLPPQTLPGLFMDTLRLVLPLFETLRDDPVGLATGLLPAMIADHLPDRYCAACSP
ncbi:lipase family protein [Methylobacterium sp. EM32]|uniref:lipase family protein n=1 Tax=Methylobacterium sp. EM32 TaxID=3163481 RepID=UPI0033A08975